MPCSTNREGVNWHLELFARALKCTCPDADTKRKDAAIYLSLAVLTDTWKLGKEEIETRLRFELSEDAPHRSTCPGCGHPECDAVGEDGT